MLETPADYNASPGLDAEGRARPYPGERLGRYSWHTGAPLRRLHPDEPCPVLFRDVGPAATADWLRGGLERLCGPYSPIIYTRTEDWQEPYVDHGQIGRLLFLRPLALGVWRSGVDHVYVARSTRTVAPDTLVYVPGHVPLAEAAEAAAAMDGAAQWREHLGGALYDDIEADAIERLTALESELEAAEALGEPLRRCLQAPSRGTRDRARAVLEDLGMSEHDLCAAWHHIAAPRRRFIREALGSARGRIEALSEGLPPGGGGVR